MKKKIRVLHIDDNLHNRKLVKDALLTESGLFEVVEADNREKFITHLDEKDFDVILSDFNILGFDGLQVLQMVKEKHPNIPVIIVTGTGSEEIAIQAMKLGAADYVIKSVNHIRGLAHSIQLALQNKKNQKARKKALAALNKSEEKYRKIFENVQDIFYQTDNLGKIIEISPSVQRFSGYTREDLMGKAASAIYSDPKNREILVTQIFQQGEVWDYEVPMNTKSGVNKYASLNAHLIYNEQKEIIGIEGSLRDITDRKKVEEELIAAKVKAEESDHLKTAFLHNISHEIRTPMNSIVGFSELLNDPEVSAEQRKDYTEIIVRSSNQLLSIITDIVSIATIEAGQEKIHESEIDLDSILRLLYDQFLPNAIKQNLSLMMSPQQSENGFRIVTDETKLVQILTNLVGNALKFTSKGSIHFGYQLNGNEIEFFVEDTGIGIPPEMHEEIFKRFRQVESTTTRQFGGSGLGLSISKSYVELLGGKMWLNSELGKGTTFRFTIPFKPVKNILPEKQSFNSTINMDNHSKTILIAEDEDLNFKLLEAFLSGTKFKLIRAVNGLEAVEMSRSHSVDLILMDIKMPKMDGYEATKQIRQFLPDLPVIAQTAYSTDADKDRAFASGCSDFITKPINKELLMVKIKELLDKE